MKLKSIRVYARADRFLLTLNRTRAEEFNAAMLQVLAVATVSKSSLGARSALLVEKTPLAWLGWCS